MEPQKRHGFPRGFTLIELIAVVVVLAVMAGVALPKYFDQSASARESADNAALGGIRTALFAAYLDHRMRDAPSGQWITSINAVGGAMQTGSLPEGLTIVSGKLQDQRGNQYTFTAETATSAAKFSLSSAASGGGGGSGWGS